MTTRTSIHDLTAYSVTSGTVLAGREAHRRRRLGPHRNRPRPWRDAIPAWDATDGISEADRSW
jgi:hypothetical protein